MIGGWPCSCKIAPPQGSCTGRGSKGISVARAQELSSAPPLSPEICYPAQRASRWCSLTSPTSPSGLGFIMARPCSGLLAIHLLEVVTSNPLQLAHPSPPSITHQAPWRGPHEQETPGRRCQGLLRRTWFSPHPATPHHGENRKPCRIRKSAWCEDPPPPQRQWYTRATKTLRPTLHTMVKTKTLHKTQISMVRGPPSALKPVFPEMGEWRS